MAETSASKFASKITSDGKIGQGGLAAGVGGTDWQSVKTTDFTAVAGQGYFVNTTSSIITVTLPSSPSIGDMVRIVDYAGTFNSNQCNIDPNGNKIETSTNVYALRGSREGASLTYIDSTQGWVATTGVNEGTQGLEVAPYTLEALIVGGGGGAGGGIGGGGGAGGYRTTSQSVTSGNTITVTVGSGGSSGPSDSTSGSAGSSSSISGTGLTTITSAGGGRGTGYTGGNGGDGGSGGGGGAGAGGATSGGSGNVPSVSPSQGNNGGGGDGPNNGGGGGGASAVGQSANSTGQNGGAGTSNSITGSAVTYAGGGGGGGRSSSGTGGAGGGGNGGGGGSGSSGTANTGGGAGGSGPGGNSAVGGTGVVIFKMPTSNYSGTVTGSPTVTTDGSYTIVKFTGSGSIVT